MNKQELIEAVIELPVDCSGSRPKIDKLTTLELIKLLDEPQKVVVPQFVADWYEENKDDFEISLFYCVYEIFKKRNDNELTKIENWVIDENTKPFLTLANMHQFGYEVEKEPKYTVRMKGIIGYPTHLNKKLDSQNWFFASKNEIDGYRVKHTRKEIEDAGFGWVFDCEGIEIEEVK